MDHRRSRIISVVLGFVLSVLWIPPLAGQQNGTGYLKTKVDPGRAGVFVDGKYLGPAANFRVARKYSLPVGEHEVKLVDPRYQEFSTKVNIEAGKTTTLSQALQAVPLAKPPFGLLRTIGPEKFAAVYVNGKFMGHLGEFNNPYQGLLLNPGEYTVKIVSPGSVSEHEEKIRIQEKQVTIVKAT